MQLAAVIAIIVNSRSLLRPEAASTAASVRPVRCVYGNRPYAEAD